MDIDTLISALVEYQRTTVDLEVCIEMCESDPSYMCAGLASKCDRKKAELTLALNQYIDSRIRHVLSGTE